MSSHSFTAPAPSSSLYDEVVHLIQQADYESALLLVQFILPPYQSHYPAHHIYSLVADIYTLLHQDEYAITYIRKAQETIPTGKRAAQQDALPLPSFSLSSSLATATASQQLTYKQVDCYIALCNNTAAMFLLDTSSFSSLSMKYVLYMAKQYEFVRKNYSKAIECYMRALTISPYCLAAVNGLVRCNATVAQLQSVTPLSTYQPMNGTSAALGVLSNSATNNNTANHHTRTSSAAALYSVPSPSLLHYITAKHHILSGAYEQALICYTILTQAHPNSFILLTEMAFIQLNCVEWEVARRTLEKVRRISQDNDICAMDLLALLYARRGMIAQIIELTQRCMTNINSVISSQNNNNSTSITSSTNTTSSTVPSDKRITRVQVWNIAALCAHMTKDDNQAIDFLHRAFNLMKEQQGFVVDTDQPQSSAHHHHHRHHQHQQHQQQQHIIHNGHSYYLNNINNYHNYYITNLIKSFLLSQYQQYLPSINIMQLLYSDHLSMNYYIFITRFYIHVLLQYALDRQALNSSRNTNDLDHNRILPASKMNIAKTVAVDINKKFRIYNNAQSLLIVGLVLSHTSDGIMKAEKALRKCISIDSDNEEGIIALCELLLKKTDPTTRPHNTRAGTQTAQSIAAAAANDSLKEMLKFVRGRTVSDACMCALARLYEMNASANASNHGDALNIVHEILKRSPRCEEAKQLLAKLNAETVDGNSNNNAMETSS